MISIKKRAVHPPINLVTERLRRKNMTVENCNKSAKVWQQRSLRSALGTIFLGTALFASVGIHQSHAGIIESSTEVTQARNKSCSGIEPSYKIKRAGQTALKHWVDRCGERAEKIGRASCRERV